MTGWDRSRDATRQAIAAIETMPSLPRPADRPEEDDHGVLPRAVGAPEGDASALPRPVTRGGADDSGDDDDGR